MKQKFIVTVETFEDDSLKGAIVSIEVDPFPKSDLESKQKMFAAHNVATQHMMAAIAMQTDNFELSLAQLCIGARRQKILVANGRSNIEGKS